MPTTAIVADDWLAWAIAHMRVTAGLRVMYRTAPTIRAARLLHAGEALLLLGDDGWGAEPRTYEVRFLDSYADLPAGMTTLSRLCQAPIVSVRRGPDRPPALAGDRRRTRPSAPPGRNGGAEERAEGVADPRRPLERADQGAPGALGCAYRIRWRPEAAP